MATAKRKPAIKTAEPRPEPPKAEVKTYNPGDWRDPASSFAPDDESLEAQMWRLGQNKPTLGR